MALNAMIFGDSTEAEARAKKRSKSKSSVSQVTGSPQRPSGILPTWTAQERPMPHRDTTRILPAAKVATAVESGPDRRTINQVRRICLVHMPHILTVYRNAAARHGRTGHRRS